MKDLVCTKCGKRIIRGADEDIAQHMKPGHCNDQTCLGKLEWIRSD